MPAPKTDTKVIIGGKVYTLSGYEGEEYIQRIASYLNGKLDDLEAQKGYSHLSQDLKNLLLEINVADDCFKAKKQVEALNESIHNRDEELYDLKHELVTTQMKLETMDKTLKKLQAELDEKTKTIIRLEAEKRN